jgi:ribonuclease P protein subunit RPR2
MHDAPSGTAASRALVEGEYAAVIADDERLEEMSGLELLGLAEQYQPEALRLLLAREESFAALEPVARVAGFCLLRRRFFAPALRQALAEYAGRRLENAPLVTEMRASVPKRISRDATRPHVVGTGQARQRMVLTMAELVEGKNGHAPGHALRVSAMAGSLGRQAGLSTEELLALEEAALLHDVGEVTFNGLHLGRHFTSAERRRLGQHVELSAETARKGGFGLDVVLAARHHHERWDGNGHPDGLAKEQIPLAARLIAIADTWDGLATSRPHRAALNRTACARTIAAAAGSQLDPDLVTLFLARRIFERAGENVSSESEHRSECAFDR